MNFNGPRVANTNLMGCSVRRFRGLWNVAGASVSHSLDSERRCIHGRWRWTHHAPLRIRVSLPMMVPAACVNRRTPSQSVLDQKPR